MNDEQDEQNEDLSKENRKDCKPNFFHMKNNNDNANENVTIEMI